MSPVEATVMKSDTSFINTVIDNCVSCFGSCVSVLETHHAVYLVYTILSQQYPNWKTGLCYDGCFSLTGVRNWMFTFIFWSSTSLGWPGNLCSGFILAFHFEVFLFFFVFMQGQILPSGTHVWFPWGSVPLMEIMSMHPRARSFPRGFILPQCANIILIKINKNCTYASREEIDSS